ncbi:MAG TPA: hypothetical protein VFV67_09350 [Actinophytocola sp.]|uniref:hypothetical protein n=1 Tax=Actinophytocola sp. TaxID=1872138 RepID=UPI002DBAA54C|nr:hypothetical protein [Actinophytocola sp.]HEU5470846.1 hypothetical protein [Actinophytocola sp.]
MTTAAWTCDSCDSNNMAGAAVCRLCKRAPGSTAGSAQPQNHRISAEFGPPTERMPRVPAAPPERVDITLTPTATGSGPAPARRSGSGRWALRILLLLALGVLMIALTGNCQELSSLLSDGQRSDVPDPAATVSETPTETEAPRAPGASSAPACPEDVATWLPGSGQSAALVAAYTTDRFTITLCRDEFGQLYYDGQITGEEVSSDTHISIPADETADGFIARNGSYVYEISGLEILITRAGEEIARWELTPNQP